MKNQLKIPCSLSLLLWIFCQTGDCKSAQPQTYVIDETLKFELNNALGVIAKSMLHTSTFANSDALPPEKMPEALSKWVTQIAGVSPKESIVYAIVDNRWQNSDLHNFQPREVVVLTDQSVYITSSWAVREKRGFSIEHIQYSLLIGDTKWSLDSRWQLFGGAVASGSSYLLLENRHKIIDEPTKIGFLYKVAEALSRYRAENSRIAISQALKLPDADLRAIKGYSTVAWGVSLKEASDRLAVKLDPDSSIIDYSNKLPNQIAELYASYDTLYGVRFSSGLSSVRYTDRSGRILLHFIHDRLAMVERTLVDDLKQNSDEAITQMLHKYGAAKRELYNLKGEGGGQLLRFLWETEDGKIIAVCNSRYSTGELAPNRQDQNEIRLSVHYIGKRAIWEPVPNKGEGEGHWRKSEPLAQGSSPSQNAHSGQLQDAIAAIAIKPRNNAAILNAPSAPSDVPDYTRNAQRLSNPPAVINPPAPSSSANSESAPPIDVRPGVKLAKGKFVELSLQLGNGDPGHDWNFEATAVVQLLDQQTMTPLAVVEPIDGRTIKHRLAPYSPTDTNLQYHENDSHLIDLPVDKIPTTPSFFRVEVQVAEPKRTVLLDFIINNGTITLVNGLAPMHNPLQSEVYAELVPAGMRVELQSIAYISKKMTAEAAKADGEMVQRTKADVRRKDAEEKAKVKAKASTDL